MNENVAVIETKLDALQHQVAKLSEVITRMAAQEERLNHIAVDLARIDAEHRKCSSECRIDSVLADIRWFRWFVMGNSTATLSMFTAIIVHYVKGVA